jgi:hypothetical protein
MPLILGIVASGNYPRSNPSYESIATVSVGSGGASDVTFSSIPSTFKHLQIRYIGRNTSTSLDVYAQLNGDTGNNYRSHYLTGDGSSASAGDIGTQAFWNGGYTSGSSQSTSVFGAAVIDILDYTNTNKNKVMRTLTGWDNNGSGQVVLYSGLWLNTAAITSIKLYKPPSGTWAQYSSFALYGIKG